MVDEIVRLAAGHLTARLSRHALGEMKFDFVGQFRAQINHYPSAETEERAVASLARADSTAAIGGESHWCKSETGNGVEGEIGRRERESNLVKSRTLVVLASLNV